MKQIVYSALAVCAGSLAFANESDDWLTLDQVQRRVHPQRGPAEQDLCSAQRLAKLPGVP